MSTCLCDTNLFGHVAGFFCYFFALFCVRVSLCAYVCLFVWVERVWWWCGGGGGVREVVYRDPGGFDLRCVP